MDDVINCRPLCEKDSGVWASTRMACAILIQTLVEDSTDDIEETCQDLVDSLDMRAMFANLSYYDGQ